VTSLSCRQKASIDRNNSSERHTWLALKCRQAAGGLLSQSDAVYLILPWCQYQ
jgi:hypothetical protein